MRLVALMYHDVVPAGAEDSSGFPGPDAALYKLDRQAFARHLDGHRTPRHGESNAGVRPPAGDAIDGVGADLR